MARRGTALVVGSGTTVQTLYTYEQQQGDWVQVGGALDTGGTVSIDLSTDGLILVVGHDVLASVLSRKPNSAVTVYWRDSVSVPFTPANSTGVAPEALPRRDEALNRALNWGFQQYIVKVRPCVGNSCSVCLHVSRLMRGGMAVVKVWLEQACVMGTLS